VQSNSSFTQSAEVSVVTSDSLKPVLFLPPDDKVLSAAMLGHAITTVENQQGFGHGNEIVYVGYTHDTDLNKRMYHFYASLHGKVMKLTFDEKGISKLALEEMRQQGLPK
jgi:hypothetical protein